MTRKFLILAALAMCLAPSIASAQYRGGRGGYGYSSYGYRRPHSGFNFSLGFGGGSRYGSYYNVGVGYGRPAYGYGYAYRPAYYRPAYSYRPVATRYYDDCYDYAPRYRYYRTNYYYERPSRPYYPRRFYRYCD